MRLQKHTNIVRAVWLGLPAMAKWALLGLGRRPGTVTLADLQRIREAS